MDNRGKIVRLPGGISNPIPLDYSATPGRHARTAIGAHALPSNVSVELELTVEVDGLGPSRLR